MKFINTTKLLITIAVATACCLTIFVSHAQAAAARCYAPIATSAHVTDCGPTTLNIEGGSFLPDHCYQVKPFGSSGVDYWAIMDCSKAPFVAPPVSTNCATPNDSCSCNSANLSKENCGIVYYLWLFINVLSGLVGIVIVISLIVAGIQWTSAGDNPQQIAAAKARIVNCLIALLVFVFTYAILQWLVPGGIF